MTKPIVIYHGNCADGFGSAWVFNRFQKCTAAAVMCMQADSACLMVIRSRPDRMSSTNEGRATLGREDFAAISAFRYALGRMTYIVSDTVNWLIESWPLLHEHARAIITRDLLEEIERDDTMRAEGSALSAFYPLGWDCDRREWLRLRDYIEGRAGFLDGGPLANPPPPSP